MNHSFPSGIRAASLCFTAAVCFSFSGQALAAAEGADGYFPPPDSAGGWRTAADAAQVRELGGMDLARLEQAWAYTQRCSPHAGLLVVRRGYLVFEKYIGRASRDTNPNMASIGKAYTAIACGIMFREFPDRIPAGLNTKVFTPEFLPEAFWADGKLDDPRRADITLGQLLCMTSGYHGDGDAPKAVVNGVMSILKPSPNQDIRDLDGSSLRCAMWTNPGGGFCYSSPAPHIASMVLRRVTGMELDEYIDERLGKPMGWGAWGYAKHLDGFTEPHANGAGGIAVRSTDAIRFGYCLLRGGKWNDRQLVPADYVALCNQMSPFNPHSPYTLMFEQNSDGHLIGAPRDAYWKSGAGGFALMVVPSLDLVIYKIGGNNWQYDPTQTKVPQPEANHDRDNWTPIPTTIFNEGTRMGDDGIRRVLEMVCGAVRID